MVGEESRLIKGDRLIEVYHYRPRKWKRDRRENESAAVPSSVSQLTALQLLSLYDAIWGLSDSNFCGKSDYEDFAPACPTGCQFPLDKLQLISAV